jgi:hypothetical protein
MLGLIPAKSRPKAFLEEYALTAEDVSKLQRASAEDARRFVYNACATFLGGLGSFYEQESAWTATKMYYTVFYLARASLCRNHTVIFHVPKERLGHTQFTLRVAIGSKSSAQTEIPSTHKLVAALFKAAGYPPFMRGLQIAGHDPLEWLMMQREHWQYRCGRFPDPDFPDCLATLDPRKISQMLEAYSHDKAGVYLADESHSLVSLPFRMLEWSLTVDSLVSTGVVEADDLRYLIGRCRIGKQRVSAVQRLLASTPMLRRSKRR